MADRKASKKEAKKAKRAAEPAQNLRAPAPPSAAGEAGAAHAVVKQIFPSLYYCRWNCGMEFGRKKGCPSRLGVRVHEKNCELRNANDLAEVAPVILPAPRVAAPARPSPPAALELRGAVDVALERWRLSALAAVVPTPPPPAPAPPCRWSRGVGGAVLEME